MSAPRLLNHVSELERRVLAALCSGTTGPEREQFLAALMSHAWQDAEHRILFEALLEFRTANPEAIRKELPAHLTRKGFPDIDWNLYLVAAGSPPAQIVKWIGELQNLSSRARGPCVSGF